MVHPETKQNLIRLGRRGRGGPPRPRRTPQIATDPPHAPYRPVRPGERVGGGDEGSHGPCVARADLTGQPAAEGAPAGRGRPSSPRRGRQCAPRGGRTRTPHGVRLRTAVARDMPRVPGPSARPRRAKKKSSPPPPHGGLTGRHGGLFEGASADPQPAPLRHRERPERTIFCPPGGSERRTRCGARGCIRRARV